MSSRIRQLSLACLTCAVMAISQSGCKKSEPAGGAKKADAKSAAPAVASAAVDEKEVTAKLAKADALDGAVDHVVAKCAGCALRMNGSADHELRVSGYKLHFCSEDCKHGFEADPKHSVLAMKIPE